MAKTQKGRTVKTSTTKVTEDVPVETTDDVGITDNLPVETSDKVGVTEDVPMETTNNVEITDTLPVEPSDEVGVTKDDLMVTTDDIKKCSNEPTVSNSESTLITDKELDLQKLCEVIENVDDVTNTNETSSKCSELNDSVTIICENEIKDDSFEITSTDIVEVDKTFEDISESEIISTNEIEAAATATQIVTSDEQTVEDGEEWTVESRLESFMKWCDNKGLTLSPKVTVKSEGTCHRYGMIATADIKKGETLFTVPRSLTLHPDNSRIVAEIVDYEDWLDSIGQSLDDSSGWATLLIALMLEYNDKDSFWAPYLRLVPKPEEFGHPLFWSPEEHKEELQGTTLLYDIQRDVYNIESEYKQFILPFIYRYKDVCGRTERYNLALYKRLVAFVMAYSFTEDFDSQPGMIPMADILNHSVNNNAHLVFGEDNLKMVALKKIDKGEEIFNTFGKLGNAELLQMYGYADKEPNIFDTLPILVNTFLDAMEKAEKVSDSFFQAKVSLLNKTEIAPADDFFLFDRNGMRKGPDLVQMLKILFMPESEFEELLKSRAGNRPDSFYQKLLRKLKLAKKTDTSSGVAIIDITDEEPESEPPPKRKIVDLQEIDDSEPPSKQGRSDDMQTMYLRLAHSHTERTFPLNMLNKQFATFENPYSNGNSISNAIVIDDSDDESKTTEEDPKPTDTKKSDSVDEKKSKPSDDKSEDSGNASKSGDKEPSSKEESRKEDEGSKLPINGLATEDDDKSSESQTSEGVSLDKDKAIDNDKTIEEKVEETPEISKSVAYKDDNKNVDDIGSKSDTDNTLEGYKSKEDTSKVVTSKGDTSKEDTSKGDKSKEDTSKVDIAKENTSKENTSNVDTSNGDNVGDEKVIEPECETKKKKESIEDANDEQQMNDIKTKGAETQENKDTSNADKRINGEIFDDIVSIGDDIDDDLGEDEDDSGSHDSDIDDIEFVSEDIRCKITYANLNKELKPEWKEFMKSVLKIQLESLKPDGEMTTDEARAKMSDRKFYSYQIRQGQRFIVKTFLSTIIT